MLPSSRVIAAFGVAFLFSKCVNAQPLRNSCSTIFRDIPVKDSIGSAGMWANIREKPGSVRFESNAIFELARNEVSTLKAPSGFCPKECVRPPKAYLVFSSIPRKVRSNYEDFEHCAALEQSSSTAPFTYTKRDVMTLDDLNSWIGDLAQGEGKDGEDLYKKCDRSCSPRFEYFISKNDEAGSSYTVKANVACGHARDKDNNEYDLKGLFRWYCQ